MRKMELMNVVLCSLIGSFSRILMIFFPFSTDSVDDAQVSSKKVMSPDHPIVNYSFTLSIANLIESRKKEFNLDRSWSICIYEFNVKNNR